MLVIKTITDHTQPSKIVVVMPYIKNPSSQTVKYNHLTGRYDNNEDKYFVSPTLSI